MNSCSNEERKEQLLKRYSNNSLFVKSGGQMQISPGHKKGSAQSKMGGKPKDSMNAIKKLFSYIGNDKIKMLFVFVCVILTSISTLGASYILRPVINNLIAPNKTIEQKISNLIIGLISMLCIYLVGVVCSYLQQRIMVIVSQNAIVKIRRDLFNKIQKLPIKYHDTHANGDIMSRFTNDLDSVGEMLNNTLSQLISGCISIVGTIVLMFITNWILAIVTIITVPLLFYVGGSIGKISRKFYKVQQQSLGAVNGYIEESVTGQKVIKVFCHEDATCQDFELLSDDLRNKQRKAQFFGGIMGPVMGNLSQVSFALSGTIGGIMCLISNFDIGGLTIFTNYSRQFSRPISELSMIMNTIYSALAGAERVFDVLNQEPETQDAPLAVEICSNQNQIEGATVIKGDVILKNVSFGYSPEKTVLKNINVNVKAGQKVAFVGSTGAGKTTITNLINRFYDIDSGNIYIDGIDIKNIKRESLRKNVTMVLQDTHLFSDTVMENIRYGRLDATDEDVINAAKVASAHYFIERLADGYNTKLESDGANLSQGERQLLNIARASISKAPILILDEATSSVDTRTEKLIEKGMDRLMKGRTTFIIAHRLSTVRNADCIIVLEHGSIVEQGTHEELLELKGRYYQLYNGTVELD